MYLGYKVTHPATVACYTVLGIVYKIFVMAATGGQYNKTWGVIKFNVYITVAFIPAHYTQARCLSH